MHSEPDPLTPALALPYAARGEAIYSDAVLDWAATLDDLALQRAKARLLGAGVASKAWDREVLGRRKRARGGDRRALPFEQDLRRNEEGRPVSSALNAGLIVRGWPDMDSLRLNELTLEAEFEGQALSDATSTRLLEEIERRFGAALNRDHFDRAVEAVAEERAYHPHRDHLDSLSWDRRSRWADLARILDCTDLLAPRMLQIMLTASVARTYAPGAKADQITTFFSARQGKKKTTALSALFYGQVYIGNIDPKNKDIDLCAAVSLCTIIDEIDEFTNRMEWPAIKRWTSQENDIFRAPYMRRPKKWPRRHVYAATTNRDDILRDDTGHRRFHILAIGDAGVEERLEHIVAIRDQLWAEAKDIFLSGTSNNTIPPRPHLWWLDDEEELVREDCAKRYEERTIIDEKVRAYLKGSSDDRHVKLAEVLEFGLGVEHAHVGRDGKLEKLAASALRKLGYVPSSDGGARIWKKHINRQLSLTEPKK